MDEMSKPSAFERDPIGVWTFYENRRQMARVAQPNAGHDALAALAQAKPNFLAVTQNIDGECDASVCLGFADSVCSKSSLRRLIIILDNLWHFMVRSTTFAAHEISAFIQRGTSPVIPQFQV